MFTAKPQKNRGAATTYFDEHLSHNDYYTQGETQAGYWIGQGSEKLGLKEGRNVERQAFLRLCDNEHPGDGKRLTQLQLSERRVFFDFTCSAPKSVSILAVTMGDSRLLQAHREASDVAFRELEAFAKTRVRRDGAMEDRLTGNLVAAAFRHTSSRALDPQLHTHFTVFNASFDSQEKRWKALQSSGMYEAIHYGTAVYRNELAQRLQGFGYGIRPTAHGFEVAGVEPKIIERFSKRSKQRDEAVAKEEKRVGRKLTKDEISNVVHKSRPRKLKDASEAQVREQQLDELGFFEKRALKKLISQASGTTAVPEEKVSLGQAVSHSLDHVFARQSVAPEHALLEAALVKGCGQVPLPDLKGLLRQNQHLVRVGSEYSTRAILEDELRLLDRVDRGLNSVPPLAPGFSSFYNVGPDQRAALELVLNAPDRITGFRGLAGTGKTTTLKELKKVLDVHGFSPVFCAPTAAATDVLRKDGFKDATTLAKFLGDETRKVSAKTVLVLDEAGAVGTQDMLRLFAAAHEGRVVLVGDTGQHAAVAQGDALRLIEEHSGYRYGRLTQIRRQKTEELRQVVSLAAEHKPGEAFQKLRTMGEVVEVPPGESAPLYGQAAAAYLSAVDHGKTALIVSPTWAEIEAVTKEVREQLQGRGTLERKEETFQVFDSLGWTDAQKVLGHFEVGMQIRFVRKTEHFAAGEVAEVTEVHGKTLVLSRQKGGSKTGEAVRFQMGRAPSSYEVGVARELQVAPGDWLLLQSNAHGFTNGERVQVKEARADGIALRDGRVMPREYRTFTHGYAVTSHAAQGKTVDEVVVVASSRSFAAISRESFYVGISRARERAQVFTDDAELLGKRVEDTHTRKAALELAGLREELLRHGLVTQKPQEEKQQQQAQMRKEAAAKKVQERPSFRVSRAMRSLRTDLSERLTRALDSLRQWTQETLGAARSFSQTRTPTVRQARMIEPFTPQQRKGQSRGIRM